MMIDGAALRGLQASLLNGDLPLDGSINLPTVLLLQNLSKRGGEQAIGELIDANAGFANPNPGENYIMLLRNGLTPERIAQFCNVENEPNQGLANSLMDSKVSSLFSILSNLYVIGRCDAGSVDEVCLRVLHKHVYETTADDFSNKLSLMRKGVVDLINTTAYSSRSASRTASSPRRSG